MNFALVNVKKSSSVKICLFFCLFCWSVQIRKIRDITTMRKLVWWQEFYWVQATGALIRIVLVNRYRIMHVRLCYNLYFRFVWSLSDWKFTIYAEKKTGTYNSNFSSFTSAAKKKKKKRETHIRKYTQRSTPSVFFYLTSLEWILFCATL